MEALWTAGGSRQQQQDRFVINLITNNPTLFRAKLMAWLRDTGSTRNTRSSSSFTASSREEVLATPDGGSEPSLTNGQLQTAPLARTRASSSAWL